MPGGDRVTVRHDGSIVVNKTRPVSRTLDPPREPSAADPPSATRLASLDARCDRIAGRSFTIALGIIGDPARAEALVQAIFLDAGRALPVTDPDPDRGDSLLLSIMRERALRMAREDRADGLPGPGSRAADSLIPIPLDLMLPREFDAAAFRGALATLSDRQREAIELAYHGGLSQRDVAHRTSLPVHMVTRQLRLALLVLRRSLEHMAAPAP